MQKRVCDNCQETIYNTQVYFKIMQVSNGNDIYNTDKEVELCSDCARKFRVSDACKLL